LPPLCSTLQEDHHRQQQQQQQQTNSFVQSPSDLKDLRSKFSQKPSENLFNSKSAMGFDQRATVDTEMAFVEPRKVNSIFLNQPQQQQQSLIYSSSSSANTPQTTTNPLANSMTVSKKAALYEQKLTEDKPQQQQQQQNSASNSSQASVVSSRRNSFNNRTVTISPTKLTSVVQQMSSPIEDVEMLSSASSTSSSSHLYKENKQTGDLQINEPMMQQPNNDSSSSTGKEPSKLSLSEKMKLFSSPGISANYENQANAIKSASSTRSSGKRASSSRYQTQVSQKDEK